MEPTNKLGKTLLGAGLALALGFAGTAKADPIDPTSYAMQNGQWGDFTYYDDTYNGDGGKTVPLDPLSGGLGDLTDGVIAGANWNITPVPYVGWQAISPTITFSFDGSHAFDEVTIYVDDSNDWGGVKPPASVNITVVGNTLRAFAIEDPVTSAPTSFTFNVGGDIGDTVVVEIVRQGPDDGGSPHSEGFHWIMVSEVDFNGLAITTTAVDIDIKPGSDPNSINLCNQGNVTVAILTTPDFDATTVDPDTATLADAEVRTVGKSNKQMARIEDVDGDGDLDLVLQFATVDLAVSFGILDTEATLNAETFGGAAVVGTDDIRIVKDC